MQNQSKKMSREFLGLDKFLDLDWQFDRDFMVASVCCYDYLLRGNSQPE